MYVQVHDTFIDHHKVTRLARELGRPRVRVRGHLVTMWLNVGRHRPDGVLTGWTSEILATYSDWNGDPDKWEKGLIDCGFIDAETREIHDWEDFFSEKIIERKREKARERQRKHRSSRDGM